MLAGLEGSLHDRVVQEQRYRDEDGLDRIVGEQFVVVGVGLRLAVKDLQRPVQVLLVNVTQRYAFAVLHMHQVAFEQPSAAAAGPDHGVLDDSV